MNDPKPKRSFYFPRAVLVVGIERRCAFPDCGAGNHLSLTKSEAIEYRGFDCTECGSWNNDSLIPGELPDSWKSESN
jgi:hypothetical protein